MASKGIPVAACELFGTFMETLGFGKNLLSLIAHFISLLSGIGVYLIILPRCINVLRQKEIKAGLLGYLLATAVISLLLIAAVSLTRTLILWLKTHSA